MPADRPAVLCVDDEDVNRKVFDFNFKQRFDVILAESGAKALEIVHSRQREIGVVIADQRMPRMTGSQLFEQLKTIIPDAYRIMVTAYSDMNAVMDAVNRGQVARYVTKPWVREELQLAIEEGLRIYSMANKLRDVELRMVKSAHLVAMGQVSASIVHEVMNPIAYITQNLGSLKRDLDELATWAKPLLKAHPDENVSHTLEDLPQIFDEMDEGIQHVKKIAQTVKAQARGVDVEEITDLKQAAMLAERMAQGEVRNRAELVTEGEPVNVKMGPVALCQVLLNLVVNAAQALDGAGRKGLIRVRWEQTAQGVSCKVTDNGIGIPPENLERVFEPLFTTKPVGIGTGLGLPICRQLVKAAGGELKLESKVGEGTTVELILARAE